MRSLVRGAVLVVLTAFSLSAFAALSEKYNDFGKGPAKWLMTRDEQKKWKSIQTDDEAQAFIDLFWARRDPTPGTFVNEYRQEFDARVKYARENYSHRITPDGAMSDRGHAVIVLGFPTQSDLDLKSNSRTSGDVGQGGGNAGNTSGGFAKGAHAMQLAERDTWIWEGKDAKKFNMPRIEALYLKDPYSGLVQRDPQRPGIITAFTNAVELAVVDKNMTVAPEWALIPPTVIEFVPAAPKTNVPTAALRKGEPGVHSLVLIKDATALAAPQSGNDPFAGTRTIGEFATSDELGYAFEYCGASETVRMTIAIRGTAGGKKVNMVAPAEDMPVEEIKGVPGCGMVRANIPLADMQVAPGKYTFSVKLEDGPKSYDLTQDFVVQ